MPYKKVGISGSPIKEGNTDTFLSTIIDDAADQGLETDIINLLNMNIKNCIHCNYCLSKKKNQIDIVL